MRAPRKYLIVLFFMAAVGARHAVPLHAQTQQTECPPECTIDTMEIVTWYPSPYNEYEELRLYPKRNDEESLCNSEDKLGLMYYNKDEQALKVCWQSPDTLMYSWEKIALGQGGYWQANGNDIFNANSGNVGIGINNPQAALHINGEIRLDTNLVSPRTLTEAEWLPLNINGNTLYVPLYYDVNNLILVGGNHSGADCVNANGTIYYVNSGVYICKFTQRSDCPVNWNQYLSWSATEPKTCNTGDSFCGPWRCDTGYHAFSNNALVENCTYAYRSGADCFPASCQTRIIEIGCK